MKNPQNEIMDGHAIAKAKEIYMELFGSFSLSQSTATTLCANKNKWSRLEGVPARKLKPMLQCLSTQHWVKFFNYVKAPFRLSFLDKIQKFLSPDEYWRFFRFAWNTAENSWEQRSLINKLINYPKGSPRSMMMAKEIAEFNKLPQTLQLYRGAMVYNALGYSWTLSRGVARWFAEKRQPHRVTMIIKGTCKKSDVFGLFLIQSEREILVNPQKVNLTGGIFTQCGNPASTIQYSMEYARNGDEILSKEHCIRVE
jgi:hypothetical protein